MRHGFRHNNNLIIKILKSYYSIKISILLFLYFALKYAYEKATILYPNMILGMHTNMLAEFLTASL